MISSWAHLKEKAKRMRTQGASIRDVESKLGIPRSTLSGWFKDITLSDTHRNILKKRHDQALIRAREKAVVWHNAQKAERLSYAQTEASKVLTNIPTGEKNILELALAMLYYGEGSKSEKGLVLGNSNSDLLLFFISALKILYGVDLTKLRCELHLRADQKPSKMVDYWSAHLDIPKNQFRGIYIDKRTTGHKTYNHYRGVCVVAYNNVAIQRKLMYLYQLYCQRVIQQTLHA